MEELGILEAGDIDEATVGIFSKRDEVGMPWGQQGAHGSGEIFPPGREKLPRLPCNQDKKPAGIGQPAGATTATVTKGEQVSKDHGLIELSLPREEQERMRQAARKASLGTTRELSIMELEERIAPGYRRGG
jgi:hypothetical protein